MSASCCSNCGCNPCGCGSCAYTIVLPDEPAPTLNFSNIGVGSIGVFDGVTSDVNVNFRGVASANAMLVATLDNVNHNVLLTVSASAIAAAFPAATTAQAGILETSTDAEAIAKAATDKIITPSNFAAMAASTTFAGFVELATNAETQAGLSALLAVTPAALASLTATQKFTTTFADAVARAAATPTFVGQFGYQVNTAVPYVGFALAPGAWLEQLTIQSGSTAPISINFDITNGQQFAVASSDSLGVATFSTIFVDFASAILRINGVNVPANSVITTSAAVGDLDSLAINTFLSAANTDGGWTVANLVPLRALDCAASTLGDVRNILGTLLNLLISGTPLKPSS